MGALVRSNYLSCVSTSHCTGWPVARLFPPRLPGARDVRTPEQYSGAQSALDPVGGHIPGAVNLPAMAALDGDGRLRHPDALRRAFASVGVRQGLPVAVYCGSGVAATQTALALEQAGIEAVVYPGSWS